MKKGFTYTKKPSPLRGEIEGSSRGGFTLVELSIVLVIIGLLISGLLVGQSMIKATKIQAFVKQMQQFEIAASNFKTMYNGLPGDSTYYGGDGDGFVETNDDEEWSGELGNYWSDLSSNGMSSDDGTYSSTFSASNFPHGAPNAPTAKIGENAGILMVAVNGSALVLDTGKTNAYYIMDCSDSTALNAFECDPSVYESEALAVDAKIDDGAGDSGDIVVFDDGDLTDWQDIAGAGESAYNLAADNIMYLVIRYGISNDDLR